LPAIIEKRPNLEEIGITVAQTTTYEEEAQGYQKKSPNSPPSKHPKQPVAQHATHRKKVSKTNLPQTKTSSQSSLQPSFCGGVYLSLAVQVLLISEWVVFFVRASV
jgi:hypothetical protein